MQEPCVLSVSSSHQEIVDVLNAVCVSTSGVCVCVCVCVCVLVVCVSTSGILCASVC